MRVPLARGALDCQFGRLKIGNKWLMIYTNCMAGWRGLSDFWA